VGTEENLLISETGSGDTVSAKFQEDVEASRAMNERALNEAIRTGNPHSVLEALMRLVRIDGIYYMSETLQQMTPNTFSNLLHCLDPRHFVHRYSKLHREISQHTWKLLKLPPIHSSGYHNFSIVFLAQIHGILEARRWSSPLSLPDYKYLLLCTRHTGNSQVADVIWANMKKRGISPDVDCFNHYLSTKAWTERSNTFQRFQVRITPKNIARRSTKRPPKYLAGHRVGLDKGIKVEVSQLFRQMVNSGIPGNEETFCLMILALAREGDLPGIASVLNRVWGVSVDGLLSNTSESDLPSVKPYPRDSPFHPSKFLLISLAHAYGINNTLPTALRLVDYISRQYKIEIPMGAWKELLQWTFVLSVPRSGVKKLSDGSTTGQLPREAVSNLWTTMTSPPYNISPTMEMYDRHITNLIYRERFGEVKERIEEGRNLHKALVSKIYNIHRYFPKHSRSDFITRKLAYYHLKLSRSRLYLHRWVRRWIKMGSKSLKYNETFTPQEIPNFLLKFNLFVPEVVKYKIANGEVQFYSGVTRLKEEVIWNIQTRLEMDTAQHHLKKEKERAQDQPGKLDGSREDDGGSDDSRRHDLGDDYGEDYDDELDDLHGDDLQGDDHEDDFELEETLRSRIPDDPGVDDSGGDKVPKSNSTPHP